MTDDTIVIGTPDLPKIEVMYAFISSESSGRRSLRGSHAEWLVARGRRRYGAYGQHARRIGNDQAVIERALCKGAGLDYH